MPRVLYLHGFASTPHSNKVHLIREQLEPAGFAFDVPDLNVPTFEALDWNAIVESVTATNREEPDVIVGSSLGALVALESVRRRRDWSAELVLVAPALGLGESWTEWLPQDESDYVEVYHHGTGELERVNRRFFHQMSGLTCDSMPPRVPVRILMGNTDESIPFAGVEQIWESWRDAGARAGSSFREIQGGDHRLLDHIDVIVAEIRLAARG